MTPEPTLRLFLALWPDDDTRTALLAWQQAQTWPATARLTRPDDLHLTLHFMGAVPQSALTELKHALPALRWTTRHYALVHSSRGYHLLQHYG